MAVFACLVWVVFIFSSGNNIGRFCDRDVKVIIIRICIKRWDVSKTTDVKLNTTHKSATTHLKEDGWSRQTLNVSILFIVCNY